MTTCQKSYLKLCTVAVDCVSFESACEVDFFWEIFQDMWGETRKVRPVTVRKAHSGSGLERSGVFLGHLANKGHALKLVVMDCLGAEEYGVWSDQEGHWCRTSPAMQCWGLSPNHLPAVRERGAGPKADDSQGEISVRRSDGEAVTVGESRKWARIAACSGGLQFGTRSAAQPRHISPSHSPPLFSPPPAVSLAFQSSAQTAFAASYLLFHFWTSVTFCSSGEWSERFFQYLVFLLASCPMGIRASCR